uniref:PPM-type phosphatase domain-containing protein n=1 Tax=Anguilla anguilla TaxID=7936 RepID=A0A0E9W0W9_ANGAN
MAWSTLTMCLLCQHMSAAAIMLATYGDQVLLHKGGQHVVADGGHDVAEV